MKRGRHPADLSVDAFEWQVSSRSAAALREAELFFRDLVGAPRRRARRPIRMRPHREGGDGEAWTPDLSADLAPAEALPDLAVVHESGPAPYDLVGESELDHTDAGEAFSLPLDAVAMWNDGKAYFFKGDEYVRYSVRDDRADAGYPKKIRDHWPGVFQRDIDAAVMWNNGKAYFFKGDEYVRYSLANDRADPGYPKKIRDHWPGLFQRDIDAAVMWNNGKAYFFKDTHYTRYSVANDRADPGYPKQIPAHWRGLIACTCSTASPYRYAFAMKSVANLIGARTHLKTRYGKLCCEGTATTASHSVAYVNISMAGTPLRWAQSGFGRSRSGGSNTGRNDRYFEVRGSATEYHIHLDTTTPPADGSTHTYEFELNKSTGTWTFKIDGTVFHRPYTSPGWRGNTGATIQWTGEIHNVDDDMPGTSGNKCSFTQCRYKVEGAAFTDAGLVAGDVRSDDNRQWGARHVSGTALDIWDKHPNP